ncbi:MAG: RNase P subunit p30 family protein [Candidatus Diapherotrites archaeon]
MNLNLIQFSELQDIEELSEKFKDEAVIVAKDFSETELKEFNSKKRKSKVKLFSCKVLEKKDNAELQKFRKLADFIAVKGGTIEMNFWAANQKVDLLLQPFSQNKNVFDLATANVLRDNKVFSCFLFNEFLEAKGFGQTQLMKNAMFCLKLIEKSKAPLLFVSGAKEKQEMRAAKDLSSFGVFLGMKKENALKAVRNNSETFLERVK